LFLKENLIKIEKWNKRNTLKKDLILKEAIEIIAKDLAKYFIKSWN
jgi:hypothetical protein